MGRGYLTKIRLWQNYSGGRPCIYAFLFVRMYDISAGMPRKARIDAPGALHHIIGRGTARRKVFLDDDDRDNFVQRLSTILSGTATSCFAWSLLPNHYHLLLRTGNVPIGSLIYLT